MHNDWCIKKQQTHAMICLTVLAPVVPGYSRKSPGGTVCWPLLCQSTRCSLSHCAPQNQSRTILHPATHTWAHTHTHTQSDFNLQVSFSVCHSSAHRGTPTSSAALTGSIMGDQWRSLCEKPNYNICHLSTITGLSIRSCQSTKV